MSILLDQLTKRFGGHPVVNRISLEIANGEFFVLIGPSGSGKSTVLRMIAGLNTVDEGHVVLHDRDVTFAPPQERGVGFVFQHYALFKHMSVADNIEFALQVRKVRAKQRQKRRDELLEIVGLAGLGSRMPAQLSGGQQQRVALARAIAHQPEVLLLDEPFGALDAKIRIELRRALRHIQKELGITTIFVTHDQEEAFELGDRLAVMNFGRLLEVGTPSELYQHPQTEFVATFLGTANLLVGETTAEGVKVGPALFPLNTEASRMERASSTQRVQVLFRPEDVTLALPQETLDTPQLGKGEIEQSTFSGSVERLRMRLPSIPGVRPIAPPVAYGENSVLIEATRTQDIARSFPLKPGDQVRVGVRRIHALLHPGLSFLILTDGSPSSEATLALGGQIARLAHARVTILTYGSNADAQNHLQEMKEKLGSGLAQLEVRVTADPADIAVAKEVERQPYDLVIAESSGMVSSESLHLAERILRAGDHHLLLVPAAHAEPTHALVCVISGEPGKEDVLFAGRFLRHLGAQCTLLTVLPLEGNNSETHDHAEKFLMGGIRTLEVLGVSAKMAIRTGEIRDEINQQMDAGKNDLLVLGAPLTYRRGQVSLEGIVGQVIKDVTTHPVLIVRSHYAAVDFRPMTSDGRINIVEKIVP